MTNSTAHLDIARRAYLKIKQAYLTEVSEVNIADNGEAYQVASYDIDQLYQDYRQYHDRQAQQNTWWRLLCRYPAEFGRWLVGRRRDRNWQRFQELNPEDDRAKKIKIKQLAFELAEQFDAVTHVTVSRSGTANAKLTAQRLKRFASSVENSDARVPSAMLMTAFQLAIKIRDTDRRRVIPGIDAPDVLWRWEKPEANTFIPFLNIANFTTISLSAIAFTICLLAPSHALISTFFANLTINAILYFSGIGIFAGLLSLTGISLLNCLILSTLITFILSLINHSHYSRYYAILDENKDGSVNDDPTEAVIEKIYQSPRFDKLILQRRQAYMVDLDICLTLRESIGNKLANPTQEHAFYNRPDRLVDDRIKALHLEYAEYRMLQQQTNQQRNLFARLIRPAPKRRFENCPEELKVKHLAFEMLDQFRELFSIDMMRASQVNQEQIAARIRAFCIDKKNHSIETTIQDQALHMALDIADYDRQQAYMTIDGQQNLIQWNDPRFRNSRFLIQAGRTMVWLAMLFATLCLLAVHTEILPAFLVTPILQGLAAMSGTSTFLTILQLTGVAILPCFIVGVIWAGAVNLVNERRNQRYHELHSEAKAEANLFQSIRSQRQQALTTATVARPAAFAEVSSPAEVDALHLPKPPDQLALHRT